MSVLVARDLEFAYGQGAVILSRVDFALETGQAALVIGDNGSGKSTLGRLVGGLGSPTRGAIEIEGRAPRTIPIRQRPAATIYLSQVSYLQFFKATIDEEIALAARQSGHPRPAPAVVSEFLLPAGDTNPRDLAYPEMWRFQVLLLGVIFNPRVLFVDEIVAPGAAAQQQALEYLLASRRASGGVTLLAYQRLIDAPFDATFDLIERRLTRRA